MLRGLGGWLLLLGVIYHPLACWGRRAGCQGAEIGPGPSLRHALAAEVRVGENPSWTGRSPLGDPTLIFNFCLGPL
jgi:hypothetical protein